MQSFIPPRSPFGLIQEDLFPDEWKILVACVMLNCTSRKQAEKVLPNFFRKWPSPESIIVSDPDEIKNEISTLGFKNRRFEILLKLAKSYSTEKWSHVKSLPGVGEYAARAWEIFCRNYLGEEAPKDHALTKYWHWRKSND